jgi:hypothetical protein
MCFEDLATCRLWLALKEVAKNQAEGIVDLAHLPCLAF